VLIEKADEFNINFKLSVKHAQSEALVKQQRFMFSFKLWYISAC